MKLFLFFAVIATVFFLCFFYFLDLVLFCLFEKRLFQQKGDTKEYLKRMEFKRKKTKQKRKKNFLLFLNCLAFEKQGEVKKAEELLPFLKEDSFLGIYQKEADH